MPPTITRDYAMRPGDHLSQKLWGIFIRKERWGLSWRGWLLVTLAGLMAAYFTFLNVHPFLAVTHRVNTKVLVVEGWIPRYAIRGGVEEFKNGSYERIFTTGGPENGNGGYTNDYNTSASVGAEILKKLGVPGDFVQMVPSHVIDRDRTYSSAVALRDWFREHNTPVHSINVLTVDAHARRTCLLYQKAFGRNVTVGIIAVSNPDYDLTQWWRYSDGVREVIGESIAYIYARFFFYPSVSSPQEKTPRAFQAAR
ncbi:MAG TPA: ElyC/SanA/YdcF family protein [Pyrinomonadaceae bacterium]|nr:ElyC/SanA/YdcF family protein [Pyrinomonadaceae bacterium]